MCGESSERKQHLISSAEKKKKVESTERRPALQNDAPYTDGEFETRRKSTTRKHVGSRK